MPPMEPAESTEVVEPGPVEVWRREWLRCREVAAILGVSERTVRRGGANLPKPVVFGARNVRYSRAETEAIQARLVAEAAA